MRETLRRIARAPTAKSLRTSWIILALALATTAVTTIVTYRSAAQSASHEFDAESELIASTVRVMMRTYAQVLRSGVALIGIKPEATKKNWRDFVAALSIDESFPGVQGIGLVKLFPKERLDRLVARERRSGTPDFAIETSGDRDTVTAIVYLEPEDERNKVAIGYDMFSEPVRRAAMEAARDDGEPHITRAVILKQEISGPVQPGVLMYLPFYRDDLKGEDVESRRQALKGYVYAAFRMGDLFDRSLARLVPRALQKVRIQVFDADPAVDGVLLYDSAPADSDGAVLNKLQKIPISGTHWYARFLSRPSHSGESSWWQPWAVAAIGTIISLLITGIAATLAVSRDRAVEAQEVLSREVTARKLAQEHELVANRELIHRVKNMMAVVASIASQTARYTPDPAKFNIVFRERLAALGRVHDMLKPNPAFQPDLDALLREVLKPYATGDSAILSVSGPPIEIPQNTAVMLSLVINELATNATKYGAWTRPSGRVSLSWSVGTRPASIETDPDAAGGETSGETGAADTITEVVLVWHERGGPKVATPTTKGFGSNVLKFAVERGLRGSYESEFHNDGLICTIRFPLEGGVSKTEISPLLS